MEKFYEKGEVLNSRMIGTILYRCPDKCSTEITLVVIMKSLDSRGNSFYSLMHLNKYLLSIYYTAEIIVGVRDIAAVVGGRCKPPT